jgi:hypothetical protein
LKDPVRWKLSALRYAVAPMRSPRVRLVNMGVRWRCGAVIALARSISEREISLIQLSLPAR